MRRVVAYFSRPISGTASARIEFDVEEDASEAFIEAKARVLAEDDGEWHAGLNFDFAGVASLDEIEVEDPQ